MNEILFHHEKKTVYVTFAAGKVRLNFVSGVIAVKRSTKTCKQIRARYKYKHAEGYNVSTY